MDDEEDRRARRNQTAVAVVGVTQPPLMKKTLYPHQRTAISLLEQRERDKCILHEHYCIETNIGIYADMAGYGKTLTLVGLIIRDQMGWNPSEEQDHVVSSISNIYGNGLILKRCFMKFQRLQATLVVASLSILHQWQEEILSTNLSFVTLTYRKQIYSFDPLSYDVVLCSPSLYNPLVDRFSTFAWKRFIYDEPTQIKIPGMHSIVAGFIWFVTASPIQLLYQNYNYQNFQQNLFSNFMDYHLFQHLIVRQNEPPSLSLPNVHHVYYECFQPLHQILRTAFPEQEMTDITPDRVRHFVQHLGVTTVTNLFEHLRVEKQEALARVEQRLAHYQFLGNTILVTKWGARRDQIVQQVQELTRRAGQFSMNDACHICLECICHPIFVTCCHHQFCGKCLFQWFKTKRNCPYCRSLITIDMLLYLCNEQEASSCTFGALASIPTVSSCRTRRKKTKATAIYEILSSKPQGKFILFSQTNDTFVVIRRLLQDFDIPFVELCGGMASRQRKLESFKTGSCPVLFLTSLIHCAGMNLQEASDIIFYHRIYEAVQNQVVKRAHRIGQDKEIVVHHLI